jgi:hypothetical protein
MRRLSLLLLVLLLPASMAFAQTGPIDKGKIEISGFGGASIPIGDLGDVADTGFSVGGSFGYYVSPRGSIGGSVVFNSHGIPEDEFVQPGVEIDADWDITEITGFWKAFFNQGGSVRPYGRIVGGIFRTSVGASASVPGVPGVSVSVSQNDFGFGAGGGLQFMGQGPVGGHVEVLLMSAFTEGSTSNYMGVRGGVNFFAGGGGS